MRVTPFRAAAALFGLGAIVGIAVLLMTRDAPRTRIDLPLKGSADRMIWLCVQPSTLAEANARAQAAHAELAARSKPLAEQTAEAMLKAMRDANEKGRSPEEIPEILRDNEAAMASLFAEIDAEFGCLPQEIVKP